MWWSWASPDLVPGVLLDILEYVGFCMRTWWLRRERLGVQCWRPEFDP